METLRTKGGTIDGTNNLRIHPGIHKRTMRGTPAHSLTGISDAGQQYLHGQTQREGF